MIKSAFKHSFQLFLTRRFQIKCFNQFPTSSLHHKGGEAFHLARFTQCVRSDCVNISSIWSSSGIYIDRRTPPEERADSPV